jgi:hypothetical protein
MNRKRWNVTAGKKGRTHRVRADVIRRVIIPFTSRDGRSLSIIHENLARYEMNSELGYGIAKYLIKAR